MNQARDQPGVHLHVQDISKRFGGQPVLDHVGFDAGERAVVPALRGLGVRRLDLAMVSHGDNDHAGGWPAVRRAFAASAVSAPDGAGIDAARPCRAERTSRPNRPRPSTAGR